MRPGDVPQEKSPNEAGGSWTRAKERAGDGAEGELTVAQGEDGSGEGAAGHATCRTRA